MEHQDRRCKSDKNARALDIKLGADVKAQSVRMCTN